MAAQSEHTLESQLKSFLEQLVNSQKLASTTFLVAYSGGVDSTVLLYLFRQLQQIVPFHLKAIHVNHGLSKNADSWADFCQDFCHQMAVPIEIATVHVDTKNGLGVEAAARLARYDALSKVSADFICLGHHQDDQAETFLMQLARGAGAKGLAAMAKVDIERRLLRPLLDAKREAVIAYARHHQLQWIEDESNEDSRYDRNFLRHTLLPVLSRRYQNISGTLARSAAHMADASDLLDDLATIDATLVIDERHQFGAIKLDSLFVLSRARQGNLIRWWLAKNQVNMPSAALLGQVLDQLQSNRTDAAIKIQVAKALTVMRYQGYAYLVQQTAKMCEVDLVWQEEATLLLPDKSHLVFTQKLGEGFAYRRDGHSLPLHIKNRQGGEYFKPSLGRPRRGLKSIMQASAVPPWLRERLPLIFMNDTLVIIPNIGVDADMQASPDEIGLMASWEPYVG